MKERFAALIGKARQIESAIQARVEGGSRSRTAVAARQPIELVHEIVRSIAQEVQPAGRGQMVFPYTHVRIWIAAASSRDRARLAATCEAPPSLEDRIHDRLAAAGCDAPGLQVKTIFVPKRKDEWTSADFHIEYSRTATATVDQPSSARIELTVIQGTADKSTYSFAGGMLSLGRGAEVRDDRDHLIRTNHVAFVQGAGEINASVSRRHARIEHDTADGTFRLHDDGASHGTSVIRNGCGVPVPRGRGLRLRSGDVIVLGQARVRVRLPDGG